MNNVTITRLFVLLVAGVLAMTAPTLSAQGAAQAEKLLASAQHKASIDGDLKAAIEDYKKAFAAAGSDRALAAQALLRMAECHQKLGDQEAQSIYSRLVREYADQKDAAGVARNRLAVNAPVTRVQGDRSVWVGYDADGFGTISPDGRFVTYTDWQNDAALALRDLTTGVNHALATGGSTQFSSISKDGRYVAYEWKDKDAPRDPWRYELRIARLQATSISESRRLYANDDVVSIAPFDWSSDGRSIAVMVARTDRTKQIGVVSVQDGALRVLKSLDWKEPKKIFFSPDARHVAYDLMVTDDSDERHIFVMAVDGSRDADVVSDASQNIIMGWSPDGRHVLFSSDRSGSVGLWATPIVEGKAGGPATLLKADIAASWSMGLNANGTLYVWKYASPIYLQASSIDLATGKLASTPTFHRFITSRGRPDWSPDGKQLAYQTCSPLGGGPCTLWIKSMDSGRLREVKLKLGYFFFPRWSPDGRELLTRGMDLRGGNNGVYRINVETGEATLVAGLRTQSMPQWSADGKQFYYYRDAALIERDLDSGGERTLTALPKMDFASIAVSPDGQSVAYEGTDAAGAQTLFVLPIGGGTPRGLFKATAPDRLMSRFDWTLDGRAIVAAKQIDPAGRGELWLIDVMAGTSRRLEVDSSRWLIGDGFRVDRAGKQIAFVAASGQPGLEIRALENFLPGPGGAPTRQNR